MPYTMEDFDRDYTENHLHLLPPEVILRNVSAEDILKSISVEDIQAFLAKMQNNK